MAIELENVEFLLKTIAEAETTLEGMSRLLDYCAAQCPDDSWQRLRQLGTGQDVTEIATWLEAVLLTEPPPRSINALYFGLFDESIGGPGELKARCRLYVAGSDRFEASDETAEWAGDPAYFPEGRYSPSAVLAALSEEARVCADEDASQFIEYFLCLGYASLAVKESRRRLEANPKLSRLLHLPMAVGFDSGDVFLLPSGSEESK